MIWIPSGRIRTTFTFTHFIIVYMCVCVSLGVLRLIRFQTNVWIASGPVQNANSNLLR